MRVGRSQHTDKSQIGAECGFIFYNVLDSECIKNVLMPMSEKGYNGYQRMKRKSALYRRHTLSKLLEKIYPSRQIAYRS